MDKNRELILLSLILDRDILILDEATNSLDNENEDLIFKILKNLSKTKTIIIATHNEKNLRYCDVVYKIENNQIFKINND